jgi:hypothetical protein
LAYRQALPVRSQSSLQTEQREESQEILRRGKGMEIVSMLMPKQAYRDEKREE